MEGDETIVTVPANPAPNTTISGRLNATNDSFRYVFNEQIVNPNGSVTVNAAHQYLLGPTAVGDLIIGQSVCGATAVDRSAPETTIDSGPSGTISSVSPSFAFSSSVGGSTFECKLDGPGVATGSYGACLSPKSYASLADGVYTFYVRATNAANVIDVNPATRVFTVDTTPPQTTIDSGPSGVTSSASPSRSKTSATTV